MKIKVFSATKSDRVKASLGTALDYLKDLKVEFSPIQYINVPEKDNDLYELNWSLSLFNWKLIRSVKLSYLESLDSEGYDGVVLFLDKNKAREESNLFGQHNFANGKSYMQVYDSNTYIHFDYNKEGVFEDYNTNKVGAIMDGTSHALIHEMMHPLSNYINTADILHAFIQEGQFDSYPHYLITNMTNIVTPEKTNAETLYETAITYLGKDITPYDEIPDSVACAITVNTIHKKAFGQPIGGEASTYNLYNALAVHPLFSRVENPQRGDVIISPTGYSMDGGKTIPNGHTGIMGDNGTIMSNDSATGLLKQNYNLETWRARYVVKGKYPMAFFRRK